MTSKKKTSKKKVSKRVLPKLDGYGGTKPIKMRQSEAKKSATIAQYREDIAKEMLAMSMTSVRDVMSWDEFGNVKLKASDNIPEYAHRAIKKVVSTTDKEGRTTTSVELHDKVQSLRLLAKAAGLLEVEQNMDKPSVIGFTVNAPDVEVIDE